ncbi:50S ribosomal protein L18 [Patescibacteria group bacterium]|nr:50S ribosomal protein L18 [Patescibacteria group bacterium]MBU1931294.1 50S ribosomal protein L18 [Patescibacteria group bacterium]
MTKSKLFLIKRRQKRVRVKVQGSAQRPRLSVFRSGKAIYAQLIDDQRGVTLAAVSEKNIKTADKLTKTAKAELVGRALAELALKKNLKQVKFDRGACRYHGRIKALAEGARQAGLEF